MISIITPDVSNNCLGRAHALAKIIKNYCDVEIVGRNFGKGIWKPLIDEKSINIYGSLKISEMAKKINGDVIYVSKPLFTSLALGLFKKMFSGKRLFLDIDDWQMGIMKDIFNKLSFFFRFKYLVSSTLKLYSVGSYWNNLFGEILIRFADEITVSNNYLREKYGGTIVWHARDTDAINPDKVCKDSSKEEHGIDKNKKIVMFFGSPRPYKGIDNLINAVSLTGAEDICLIIVGIDSEAYSQKLKKLGEEILCDRFLTFSVQPFDKVPEILAMADVIVIPQKRSPATVGQIPAKIFDAMAMAKPIISTNVSDLPEILDGCGWIVEPDNSEQLAETIQYVLGNPEEAQRTGMRARKKCIEKYSQNVMQKVLTSMLEKYEQI